MEPAITRSIQEGFRIANKSRVGMMYFVGGWIVIGVVTVLLFSFTTTVAPLPKALLQPPAPATAPVAATASTPVPPQAAQPAAPQPDAQKTAVDEQSREEQLALEWMGHAWPWVAVIMMWLLVAGSWLYGAQLGYLTKQARNEADAPAEFWRAGTRALGAMIACTLLFLVASLVVALGVGLIVWVLSHLPQVLAAAVIGIMLAALLAAVIWVVVPLTFWIIAVVADRLSPIAGLKAAFAAARGRWWKTLGLLACVLLITLAIGVPLGLLQGLGNALGGVVGSVIAVVSMLLQVMAVNLYLGFVFSAACLRYYDDAKAA